MSKKGGNMTAFENTMTAEQIEALLEQAARERERLAQENLPQWYYPHSTKG